MGKSLTGHALLAQLNKDRQVMALPAIEDDRGLDTGDTRAVREAIKRTVFQVLRIPHHQLSEGLTKIEFIYGLDMRVKPYWPVMDRFVGYRQVQTRRQGRSGLVWQLKSPAAMVDLGETDIP